MYALSFAVQKLLRERDGEFAVEFFVDELGAPEEAKILEFMRANFSPDEQAQIIAQAQQG